MRRSGTTILYDALLEDPEVAASTSRCASRTSRSAAAAARARRRLRRDARAARALPRRALPGRSPIDEFNWGGPRDPALELEPGLPDHVRGFLASLLAEGPGVAIKETRLYRKLAGGRRARSRRAAGPPRPRPALGGRVDDAGARAQARRQLPDRRRLLRGAHEAQAVVEPGALGGHHRRSATGGREDGAGRPTSRACSPSGATPSRDAPRGGGVRRALRAAAPRGPRAPTRTRRSSRVYALLERPLPEAVSRWARDNVRAAPRCPSATTRAGPRRSSGWGSPRPSPPPGMRPTRRS